MSFDKFRDKYFRFRGYKRFHNEDDEETTPDQLMQMSDEDKNTDLQQPINPLRVARGRQNKDHAPPPPQGIRPNYVTGLERIQHNYESDHSDNNESYDPYASSSYPQMHKHGPLNVRRHQSPSPRSPKSVTWDKNIKSPSWTNF